MSKFDLKNRIAGHADYIETPSRAAQVLLPSPITFLLLPRFTSIALFSAVEALRVANRYVPKPYHWNLASLDGESVLDINGIPITTAGRFDELSSQSSTILIAGGDDPEASCTPELCSQLRWLSSQGVTLGGLDTGQQILARARLFNGHRVTVHWENAPAFREHHNTLEISQNLYEFDRNRVTCAGGTAGIDMVLHAVECDHGHDYAVRISEHLMHERIRSGSEHQKMTITDRWDVYHPKLVRLIEIMEANIEEPLTTIQLAEAARISSRQLSRLFNKYLNISPGQFYLGLRVERAHMLLIHSQMSVISIAFACGFQSQSHFSRVYRETYGFPPGQARKQTQDRHLVAVDAHTPVTMPVSD
ncbi:GlxA family transcriptional regulator [uncultured Rubinisphaera sp.]|uniref:GlxA family transcriptional regulator n=1 Tax=uncultured Rubinisphaera sp. TaxID=1678686 RepID=UPI0030DD83D7